MIRENISQLAQRKMGMKYKGFTLIELMIVVAIMGILSMFAMPAYQNYTKRTYISEGLALAGIAKLSIVETVAATGIWPLSNEDAGLPPAEEVIGQAVNAMGIVNAKDLKGTQEISSIVIRYNNKVIEGYDSVKDFTGFDNAVVIVPNLAGDATKFGSYQWKCFAYDKDSIKAQWLPGTCRDELSA